MSNSPSSCIKTRVVTFRFVTFRIKEVVTFCVKKLLQFTLKKLLRFASKSRGIEWSHSILKCSQNLAFARIGLITVFDAVLTGRQTGLK